MNSGEANESGLGREYELAFRTEHNANTGQWEVHGQIVGMVASDLDRAVIEALCRFLSTQVDYEMLTADADGDVRMAIVSVKESDIVHTGPSLDYAVEEMAMAVLEFLKRPGGAA